MGRFQPGKGRCVNLRGEVLGDEPRVASTDSPVFSAVTVASGGAMARMNTVHPATFVAFKRWLASSCVTASTRLLYLCYIRASLLATGRFAS
jgi:hypothetical protein